VQYADGLAEKYSLALSPNIIKWLQGLRNHYRTNTAEMQHGYELDYLRYFPDRGFSDNYGFFRAVVRKYIELNPKITYA
jgi:hypothetical protein